jgi:hypothetical protein
MERIAECQARVLVILNALASNGIYSEHAVESMLADRLAPWLQPLIPEALANTSLDRVFPASLIVAARHFGQLAESAERRGVDFRSFDAYDNSWMMEKN